MRFVLKLLGVTYSAMYHKPVSNTITTTGKVTDPE